MKRTRIVREGDKKKARQEKRGSKGDVYMQKSQSRCRRRRRKQNETKQIYKDIDEKGVWIVAGSKILSRAFAEEWEMPCLNPYWVGNGE